MRGDGGTLPRHAGVMLIDAALPACSMFITRHRKETQFPRAYMEKLFLS